MSPKFAPRTEERSFRAGSETLTATIVHSDPERVCSVISFHGTGAASDRSRVRYLLDDFAGRGISSVCFDFSGHGGSTGSMDGATLNIRLGEARAAAALLGNSLPGKAAPRTIIGSSMGGFLAAMLVQELAADSLLLICPSAYPVEAFHLRFGETFYDVTRRPGAWAGSPAFGAMATFSGDLLILAGRHDTIIPVGVIETYFSSASHARRKKLIWLEDADHKVHAWLEKHDSERKRLMPEILALVEGK